MKEREDKRREKRKEKGKRERNRDERSRDGQKKPKKLNLLKTQTEIEPKNKLTKSNGSVLVFVLHKSRFC